MGRMPRMIRAVSRDNSRPEVFPGHLLRGMFRDTQFSLYRDGIGPLFFKGIPPLGTLPLRHYWKDMVNLVQSRFYIEFCLVVCQTGIEKYLKIKLWAEKI